MVFFCQNILFGFLTDRCQDFMMLIKVKGYVFHFRPQCFNCCNTGCIFCFCVCLHFILNYCLDSANRRIIFFSNLIFIWGSASHYLNDRPPQSMLPSLPTFLWKYFTVLHFNMAFSRYNELFSFYRCFRLQVL